MDIVAEPQRQLVTTAGTMFQLSIGRTSLYGLFASGELTPIKVGNRTYIAQADINAYVNRLRQQAGEVGA